jgi:DNA-binding response OmpR family regulator
MNTERRKILAIPPLLPDDHPIRVLLVDDQVIIGEAVRRALADHPEIVLHFCGDAAEAIDVATRFKPTVILQDLVMPAVDGLTLLYRYRTNEATKTIPVVMLSTKEDPKTKSEAFRLGANDYLVKLPDTVELIARIQYHSKAYAVQVQRDEAYRALQETQRDLVEANTSLQRLTNVDGLTGLSNRRYFDEYVIGQWKLAIREQNPFSVLTRGARDTPPAGHRKIRVSVAPATTRGRPPFEYAPVHRFDLPDLPPAFAAPATLTLRRRGFAPCGPTTGKESSSMPKIPPSASSAIVLRPEALRDTSKSVA